MSRLAAIAGLFSIRAAFAGLLAAAIFFGVCEGQAVQMTKVERLCVMRPAGHRSSLFSTREPVVGDCHKLRDIHIKTSWRTRIFQLGPARTEATFRQAYNSTALNRDL